MFGSTTAELSRKHKEGGCVVLCKGCVCVCVCVSKRRRVCVSQQTMPAFIQLLSSHHVQPPHTPEKYTIYLFMLKSIWCCSNEQLLKDKGHYTTATAASFSQGGGGGGALAKRRKCIWEATMDAKLFQGS